MSVYKRGDSFYFDFREGGERFVGRIGPVSRTVAKEIEAKKRGDVIAGRHLPRARQGKLVETWTNEFLEAKRHDPAVKPRTVVRYENAMAHVVEFFKHKSLDDLSSFLIKKYAKERLESVKGPKRKGPTRATVNRELATLRHCLNLAVTRGLLPSNPMTRAGDRVRLMKEDNLRLRFLSEAEEEKLLAACNHQIRPLVLAAIHTGGRASELLGLKWADVDASKRVLRFLACYSKSGESRTVPISQTLFRVLESLKLAQDPPSESIFCSRDGMPYRSYRTAFATARKKAGLSDLHFHDLRHTFASRLVMRGVDLVTVKELLGHKNITMTLRYSHLSHEHKQRAVAVLDQLQPVKIADKVPSNFTTADKMPLHIKSITH